MKIKLLPVFFGDQGRLIGFLFWILTPVFLELKKFLRPEHVRI